MIAMVLTLFGTYAKLPKLLRKGAQLLCLT